MVGESRGGPPSGFRLAKDGHEAGRGEVEERLLEVCIRAFCPDLEDP